MAYQQRPDQFSLKIACLNCSCCIIRGYNTSSIIESLIKVSCRLNSGFVQAVFWAIFEKKDMKNTVIISLAIVIFFFCIGSKQVNAPAENSTALVNQIDGMYIFYQAKPVKDFETVGTVKPGVMLTGSPQERINGLVKNAKKKFPAGEGVLIGDIDMSQCDVIKFK